MPKQQLVDIEGHELTISNTGKIYFPGTGFTKGEVIAFYTAIADIILPRLRDRPLTLKRYPDGIAGEPFYEKNARHARSLGRPISATSKNTFCSPKLRS